MPRRTPRVVLSSILVLFSAMAASANGPWGQGLLRPDSLAGWDHGQTPPAGWTIADGRLTGKADAAPLLSGFSFGDFELRFQWSAAPGAALKILLPEVPHGKGIEIALGEGDACGKCIDGEKQIARGAKVGSPAGAMHVAAVRREGAKLAVTVDGRAVAEVELSPQRRFGLGLAVAGGEASLSDLRIEEPAGEPIFNGKDLSGWWCPGKLDAWAVEDGQIVLAGSGGNYLRTEKEYANFTLSLEYKTKKGCNSGIGIRTPRGGWPSGDGMELQIYDRPPGERVDKHSQMAIYGNVPPIARADKSEQWNRLVVKADGPMISAWVNGELVQQCNTFRHPELKHRNLSGWIGIQDHGPWIRVRDVRVLAAPDGQGLDAWRHPRGKRAVETIVDRLMNPEVLADLDDGIRSVVAVKQVAAADAKECVLADLEGPGAVVRIARTGGDGRVAFYFDGEERPRIECKPGDLWKALPELTESNNPALTCLTFGRRLKVVLRGGKPGEYRIDWLRFPAEYRVASFDRSGPGAPPRWIEAVVYRCNQAGWGTHREHDPLPRSDSPKKKIAPGKTETLLRLDGAGTLRWLKLRANKKALESNDLWLEVTVDGEAAPALAAPARFLFAGLAGQGNFANFAMTDRGGPTFLLPMPYANGLVVAARNAGKTPIADVGVTVSVAPGTVPIFAPGTVPIFAPAKMGLSPSAPSSAPPGAAPAKTAPRSDSSRVRLRGVFQPADAEGDALLRREGRGRLIGLVCQLPAKEPVKVLSLTVDGKPADGWSADSFDALLGQSGDFRAPTSGRRGDLCWRYLLMEAVDFSQSLLLKTSTKGDCLGLFYAER